MDKTITSYNLFTGEPVIKEFPVIGWSKDENGNATIPLLDIPMMSDEKWKELSEGRFRCHE